MSTTLALPRIAVEPVQASLPVPDSFLRSRTESATQEALIRDPFRLTVLVPAHNEEDCIEQTLTSLKQQHRAPDRVIVIADNCTDATVSIARDNGADVYETVNNTEKKAGGLNQALSRVLPTTSSNDVVLVMDADTIMVPEFIEVALTRMHRDNIDAIGGVFYGEEGGGFIGLLQRSEYLRYSRDIGRHKGRVLVLSGTASIFRADLMKRIAAERGTSFPGSPGQVYDTLAMTEDNEITLAAKTLGAKLLSPQECQTVTEIMPNWRALWKQRMRWQRGALDNIKHYGITRATLRYWLQQIGLGYAVIALNAYLFLMLVSIIAGRFQCVNIWLAIAGIFVAERVVTVWRGGWKARLVAAVLFIELAYDMFQQAVYVKSLIDLLRRKAVGWNHVPRDGGPKSKTSLAPQARRGLFAAAFCTTTLYVAAHGVAVAGAIHSTAAGFMFTDTEHFLYLLVATNTAIYALLAAVKLIPLRKA